MSEQDDTSAPVTNAERARWGQACLHGLAERTGDYDGIDLTPGTDPHHVQDMLVDALAHLRHYADAAGIDFDLASTRAEGWHRLEKGRKQVDIPGRRQTYLAVFDNASDALADLADHTTIAIACLDRRGVEAACGPLTDVQWAQMRPLLSSYQTFAASSGADTAFVDHLVLTAIGGADTHSDQR
ncbi:hypothetical protein AB0B66_10575 [Catellatospora sp. NPDC049111]|uniref:hypothetical protein n=1 Tax=Catellatospora sp. NPDC049111 TaxID=3155271 RepID=UPI003403923C